MQDVDENTIGNLIPSEHRIVAKDRLFPVMVVLATISAFLATNFFDLWFLDDVIRMVTGMIGLIVIPGETISTIAFGEKRPKGFGIIAGVLLSIFEIQLLFILTLSFGIIVPLYIWLSGCSLILFVILTLSNGGVAEIFDARKRYDSFIDRYDSRFILVIILGVAIRFIFLPIAMSSFAPDAGLYFDYARNVNDGQFQSNISNDGSVRARISTIDEITHQTVTYLYALSYMLSPIEGANPILILVLFGVLLIVVTYEITERIFSKSSALITSLLVATHPTLVYFSVVGYGPEMISLVFLLYTFLFIQSKEIPRKTRFLLSGLLLVVIESIWYINFLIAIFVFPAMLILSDGKISRRTVIITCLLVGTLLARQFNSNVLMFILLWSSIFILLIIFKKKFYETDVHEFAPFFVGLFVTNILFYLPAQILSVIASAKIPSVGLSNLPGVLFSLPSLDYIIGGILLVSWHVTPVIGILVIMGLKSHRENKSFTTLFMIAVLVVLGSAVVLSSIEPMLPQYLYTSSRFLLLVISLMCILSGVVLSQILDRVTDPTFKLPTPTIEKSQMKTIGAIIIIFGASFAPGYYVFQVHSTFVNPTVRYGWHDVQTWVHENTAQDDVFLLDRAREFAWLAERPTVYLNLHRTRSLEWTATAALLQMAQRFSADYFLMDKYTIQHWANFEYLYSGPISHETSVILDAAECSNLVNRTQPMSMQTITLEMQTAPNEEGNYVRVFTFSNREYSPLWKTQNLDGNWTVTNGELLEENNKTKLYIDEDGVSEVHRVESQQLNIDIVSGFLIIDVDAFNANIFTISIIDGFGNTLQMLEGVTEGIYYAPLDNCTVGDVRIQVEGIAGDCITINEIAIWQELTLPLPES